MASLEKAIEDIRDFKVQGANQIAIYGLVFLKNFAKTHGFDLKFEAAAHFLEKARPTAVVLHNCVEIVKRKKKISAINDLVKNLETVGEREARHADKILKDGFKIMTYCHSGEAMTFIKHVWLTHKRKISVIACETEPLEQGIRTARELADAKIPVTLIDDNAMGFFMKGVDVVVVGADALRPEGLVNKIGTSLMAQAARNARKPFYVVANTLKFDRRKGFKIEERSEKEIYRKLINKGKMKGVKIRNPAFDVTPWKYVTAVVTEKGILKPDKIIKELAR